MKYTPITEATAVQFNDLDSIKEMIDCFGKHFKFTLFGGNHWGLQIEDLEGDPRAELTDWVIMTPDDEDDSPRFSALTDEVFKKRYTGE